MRLTLNILARLFLFIFSFCFVHNFGFAQIDMPFYGGSTLVLKDEILSDSSGTYYLYDHDTFNVVFLSRFDPNDPNPRIYKLFDSNYRLRVKGQIAKVLKEGTDFIKEGTWIEFYPNGNQKILGFYEQDIAVDFWQHYFDNGYLKMSYNFRRKLLNGMVYTLLEGPYEYYYENGQVKILGYYTIYPKEIIRQKSNQATGEKSAVTETILDTKKSGLWRYYKPNGEEAGTEQY